MGDDQKLRLARHAAHIGGVTADVRLVQGGLDLVHDAEGRGPHLQNGKVQRDGHEGHFAAGHEADGGQGLAGRLHLDFDAALQHVRLVLQNQSRLAAAEKLQEGLPEGGVDGLELGQEHGLHLPGNVPDDVQKLFLRLLHVVPLLAQKLIAAVDAPVFLDGAQVRRAEGVDLPAQLGDLLVGLGQALHRLAQGLGSGMAQLVVLPELIQDLLFLHVRGQLFLFQPGDHVAQIQDFGVAVLGLFLGPGALALQLQLAFGDPVDLLPDVADRLPIRLQLLLLLPQALAKALDLPVGGFHRAAAHVAVAGEAVQQELQLVIVVLGGALFRLKGGHAASQLRLILQGHIQLIADGGLVGASPLQFLAALALVLGHFLPLLAELFQLVGPGEDAAVFHAAAAGHGAAGVDKLTVQGHDAQAVAVLAGHADGVAQALGHDSAAQEVGHNLLISRVEFHQLVGHAHEAGVPLRRVFHHRAPDRIQGQEGGAAGVHALEHLDGVAAVVLAVDDDVLGGRAQRGLDGEGALIIGADEVGHRAVHAPEIAPLRLSHHGLDRAGIALVILFHIRQHADAPVHAAQLDGQGGGLLTELGDHALPVLELHAAAVEDVVVLFGLILQGGQLLGDCRQALFAALDPGADLVRPALLLGDVPEHALLALHTALDVGPQYRRRGIALRRRRLGQAQALAGLLTLHVLLVHPLGDAAGGGVEGLQIALGLFQALRGLVVFLIDADGLLVEFIQRGHPGRNLPHFQLVPQSQIAFGHLGLLFQGADLQLQLLDLVVDAQEIVLGLLQLPLGLLLPVAEAGDARGLFKDLATVSGLGGDDLRDAALADDGVAVAAQARIHEKRVDVLEAHGLAVDEVFALPAAVIAAGQHDLRAVGIEDMGGVVDDQRDLRKAQRAALLGAAEDDVLHLAAAQRLAPLLAHDPEDSVGDVGLPRAVGPHDGRDIFFKCEPGLVREGLETLDLQCF